MTREIEISIKGKVLIKEREKHNPPLCRMAINLNQNQFRSENKMSIILTATQYVNAYVDFLDRHGNPAKIDGMPEWRSTNLEIVTVEASDSGTSAQIFALGPTGCGQITVTADARLGDETIPISGILDIEVIAGEAAMVKITTGTPEEQP